MPVSAPDDLHATLQKALQIDLAWTNHGSYTSLRVERKIWTGAFVEIASLAWYATSYASTGLAVDTLYTYRVRAYVSGVGYSSYTNEASKTTPSLGIPVLTAHASGATIVLAWTVSDPDHQITRFFIERKPLGGAFAYLDYMGPTARGYTDRSPSAAIQYVYRVQSTGAGGPSAYSNEASSHTGLPAPTGLDGWADSPTEITVTWKDNSQNETYFSIEWRVRGSVQWDLAWVGANVKTYQATGLFPATWYEFKVQAWNAATPSGFSNIASVFTSDPPKKPSNLTVTPTGIMTARLNWQDNSTNEADFHIEQSPAPAVVSEANHHVDFAEGAGQLGALLPSGTYSGLTLAAALKTQLDAAGALTYTVTYNEVTGKFTIAATGAFALLWHSGTHNAEGQGVLFGFAHTDLSGAATYTSDSAVNGFVQIATVEANVKTYLVTGLAAAQYWFRVRAHRTAGYSGYSNVATTIPFADIAAPTNVVATAISSVLAEVTFEDNSNVEDDHHVEVNTDSGGWVETVLLAPNRTYFQLTIAPGSTYAVRIRAHQTLGDLYSDYSNEAAVSPLTVPAAPTFLAVIELQDTWVRLAWGLSAGELGYRIQQSVDNGANYTDVVSIGPGIGSLKIGGLTASTHYHFQVCAYNGAGDSAYSDDVGQTTRAAYLYSKFDRLIRKSNARFIYLVEVNPLLVLVGWALTAGQTYTYEIDFDEKGAALDGAYEDGVALTAKTSIATVEATAGTYWHDTTAKKVYVHPSADGDPVYHLYTGSFWLNFTTWQKGATIFNGNYYFPLVPGDGIPDISQEIQPFYEGNFTISSGEISLINGKLKKYGFFFDGIFRRYQWINRRVRIRAGGEGFTYAEFKKINAGIIHAANITDQRFRMNIRDIRDGIHRDMPTEKYSLNIFPYMDESKDGLERPFAIGAITNFVPNCIDTVRRIFEVNNGRIKSVTVKQNGTTLTENTNYFVDYQRGRFTLARGLAYLSEDMLLVNFTACTNEAGDTAANGADAFKMICNDFIGLADEDLDLDAIYATKIARTVSISMSLRAATGSQEVIKTIEQSIRASSVQDEEGRIGLRAEQTAPESGAPYIWDLHVRDFAAGISPDSLFSEINVYYGEDPSVDGKYSLSQTLVPSMTWRNGIRRPLDLFVALGTVADAADLGTTIIGLMERPPISFTVPGVLFACQPGDVVPFNRTRFPSSYARTAANLPVRILGIDKLISSRQTAIRGEVVE